jgi:hypothetical protein
VSKRTAIFYACYILSMVDEVWRGVASDLWVNFAAAWLFSATMRLGSVLIVNEMRWFQLLYEVGFGMLALVIAYSLIS